MHLTLVVLAAGLSTRYGQLKQLEPVGPAEEALLDYAVFDAARAGFTRVVLVIRGEHEPIFRDHVRRVVGSALAWSFVAQDPWDLPSGYVPPSGRRKPWGTGHAVLSVRDVVDGPFAVCNADDFYGADSYSLLAEHFRYTQSVGDPSFAMIGFRVRDTLSLSGGVSRAVCRLDSDGDLEEIAEVCDIRAENDGIAGVSMDGHPRMLAPEKLVSTNLWGFRPSLFELLEHRFVDFLERTAGRDEAEFLLSEAIGELLTFRAVRVRVFPTPGPFCGLTHAEDLDAVRHHINLQVAEGHYPLDLAEAFRKRSKRRGGT
jgi:NDP-sugar pyrophosphorylase family protein